VAAAAALLVWAAAAACSRVNVVQHQLRLAGVLYSCAYCAVVLMIQRSQRLPCCKHSNVSDIVEYFVWPTAVQGPGVLNEGLQLLLVLLL
jgi:hypothetical protein